MTVVRFCCIWKERVFETPTQQNLRSQKNFKKKKEVCTRWCVDIRIR